MRQRAGEGRANPLNRFDQGPLAVVTARRTPSAGEMLLIASAWPGQGSTQLIGLPALLNGWRQTRQVAVTSSTSSSDRTKLLTVRFGRKQTFRIGSLLIERPAAPLPSKTILLNHNRKGMKL
jgi:hypothetical protein